MHFHHPHEEQPELGIKHSHVTGQECGRAAEEQHGPYSGLRGATAHPQKGICGGAAKTRTVTYKEGKAPQTSGGFEQPRRTKPGTYLHCEGAAMLTSLHGAA